MVMVDSIRADKVLETLLLAELDEKEQAVFSKVSALDYGTSLLSFLDSNSNTMSTADAIAFRIGRDQQAVESTLHELAELGLVRRLDVGPTLWGLTKDPDSRRLVRDLVSWQNRWHVRLARLDRAVRGLPCDDETQHTDDSHRDCAEHTDCSRCASFLLAAIANLRAA